VRVLNAVEHQQKAGSSSVSRTSSSVTWRCVASTVAITPWCLAPGAIACQARRVHRQHAHGGELGVLKQVTQTSVVASCVDVDLAHRAGVVAQFGEDE
jgi:hypothetical protein